MRVFIDGIEPKKAHENDAAFDLKAQYGVGLDPGHHAVIPCGFAVAIPARYVGLICPRSGLAARHGVTVLNSPGVIDPSYRGTVCVVLINLGNDHFVVKPGDRIAQILIVPNTQIEFVQNKNAFLPFVTERDKDGFGSTGIN